MKKLLRILSALILMFIISANYAYTATYGSSPRTIVKDYLVEVGFPRNGHSLYDQCIETYGEPDSVEIIEPEREEHGFYTIYLYYEKMTFCFRMWDTDNFEDTSKWKIENVTTCDPEHRFGLLGVGVGSPRWLVRLAYWRSDIVNRYEDRDNFRDGGVDRWGMYTYDDNNRVTSIMFNFG